MTVAIKLPMTPQKMASTIYSLLSGPKVFGPRHNRGLLVRSRGKRRWIIPHFSKKGKEVNRVATLSLVGGRCQCTWTISGLQNAFTEENNYACAGITTEPFDSGCTSLPGTILASKSAEAGNTNNWVRGTCYWPPGTYTFYGFTQSTGGQYWNAGSSSVTIKPLRPDYWSWTNGLVASKPSVGALSPGDDIPAYLSADGWTSFVQNIRDVYDCYMGQAYSGNLSNGGNGTTKLSAAMVNQAISAIGEMTSAYLPEPTTANVTKLSASLLNGLADSLNSIL